MRTLRSRRSKIAISAVIGTVLMFAMLLSVAGSYFYFIQQDQATFQKDVAQSNNNVLDDQSEEHFTVYGISQSGELAFYVNNTGISISIVAYWVLYQNGTVVQYQNTTTLSSALPFYVGQGESATFSATSLNPQIEIPTNGEYVIKVLSSRGTQGVGTYPSQQVTGATVDSLVAGGFGSLQMQFSSFEWYSYSSGPVQTQYNTVVSTSTGGFGQTETLTSTQTLNNLCANPTQDETNCNSGSYVLDIDHPHSGVLVPGGYQPTLTYYTTSTLSSTTTGTTTTTSTGSGKTTTTSTSTGSLALDGSNTVETNTGASSIQSGTLTTSNTNDVIIVYVSTADSGQNTPPTVTGITNTGGSLTWHSRVSTSTYNYDGHSGYTTYLTEWYATTTSTFSGKITASLSGSFTAEAWITVFGISGANTASPFDPNTSVPQTSSANSPSTTMSTSNANDMLLYSCAPNNGGMANGYSTIQSDGNYNDQNDYTGYNVVSSTQSNVQTSCGSNADGVEITDAVVASTSTTTQTSSYTTTQRITSTYTSTSSSTATYTSSTSKLFQIPIAFSVNITNDDPSLGTIVINSASNLWVVETCDSGVTEGNCPSGNPFFVFYIMDVNSTTGVVTSTTPGSFAEITIPYGVTKTLYYGAAYDLSLQSFSPVGLESAISNNPFYYGQFAVFLLFSGTKIISPTVEVYGQNIPFESTTAADNFGWIYETPTTANPGTATTFSLSVNDSIFAYANPTNPVGIEEVVLNASAFGSISVSGFSPPTGWTAQVNTPSTGYITWETAIPADYITNGTTDTFMWQGTAPSPSASTQYIFPIVITWTTGDITTVQSALECTVS